MEMTNFTVVSAVLRNSYWSRNLISPCHFRVISPRNPTSFTKPFLAERRARAGHETNGTLPSFVTLLYEDITASGWSDVHLCLTKGNIIVDNHIYNHLTFPAHWCHTCTMQCILPFAKLLPLCYELERVNCYPHYRLERVNCYPGCYGLDCYPHYRLERVNCYPHYQLERVNWLACVEFIGEGSTHSVLLSYKNTWSPWDRLQGAKILYGFYDYPLSRIYPIWVHMELRSCCRCENISLLCAHGR